MVENRDNEPRAHRRKGTGRATGEHGSATGDDRAVKTAKPKHILSTDCSWLHVSSMPATLPPGITGAQMRRLSKVGESIRYGLWRFEIVDVEGQRIDKVLLVPQRALHRNA